jgi:hypothetical protein
VSLKTIDFYKILELGLDKILADDRDRIYCISNYTKLEEALGLGVLEFKRRLSAGSRPGKFNPTPYIELAKVKMPDNHVSVDKETGSFRLDLTSAYVHPGKEDCVEVHVFLDNSHDSYRQLIQNLDIICYELDLESYASFELISNLDSRVCSAQFNFYGDDAPIYAIKAAEQIDKIIHSDKVGYKLGEIYPQQKSEFSTCLPMRKGVFRKRKERVFSQFWEFLRKENKLLVVELKQDYKKIIEAYKNSVPSNT